MCYAFKIKLYNFVMKMRSETIMCIYLLVICFTHIVQADNEALAIGMFIVLFF